MRNPALQLVGIAASPAVGAGGVRAEEEQLRNWLEQRLDALGIDPVAYSRFVLSLLRHPDDSALSPQPSSTLTAHQHQQQQQQHRQRATAAATAAFKPTSRLPARCSKLPLQGDREQRRAVVQCLTNAADQKCGVESLVDELCAKLRDLEGSDSKDEREELKTATEAEAKVPYETLTPRDRALRYYAAFPALQPTTPKKPPHRKERVSSSSNNNNNNNNNNNHCNNNNIKKNNCLSNSNNKNNNNKARQKKNKVTIATESPKKDMEESRFAKTMERQRDEEQELAMDQLKLAQLKAKFDQSLEALWDSGPGISQGTDSIWAAPSLSIPSGPLWPTDHGDVPFPMITFEKGTVDTEFCYRETHIDDSPLIPWDVDLFSIEDCSDESGSKEKTQDATWKDSGGDGPWRWGGLNNITTLGQSPRSGSCYYPVVPVTAEKESATQQKADHADEPEEDLLTSARTHFRPIKEDGHYTDGTTFPVNNNLERVAYRRSESGSLFYLPGGESPYMEYRERSAWKDIIAPVAVSAAVSANLTLKFRVRQCDKSIQTEPIRSPVKRRILSEKDRMYYLSNAAEEVSMNENEENEKDSFDLEQVGWDQSTMLSRSERKRRHSSNFKSRPLTVLRPLTL